MKQKSYAIKLRTAFNWTPVEKLKLPIFTINIVPPRVLSMDDYLKFVQFNLKYVVDRKAYRALKKKQAVNVRFSL